MKVLVNCSGLSRGGVVQASLSFLEECRKRTEDSFYVVLIKSQSLVFKIETFPNNFRFYLVDKSPIRSLRTVFKLRKLENIIKPDVVFTPFGVSFWSPKAPHLAGFALPFLVYPESCFFKLHKPSVKFKFEKFVILFLAKHTIDQIYVENEDIKDRLIRLFDFNSNRVHYVPGAYNQVFDLPPIKREPFLPEKQKGEFRFVTISPYFKHKNLAIIKGVVNLLKEKGVHHIKFILTIDDHSFTKNFIDYKDSVINVGPIKIEDCPVLYSECDASFMPTLLESFTAIYPDSMKMKKPIITTNLGFATSVCGDASLYFDPASASDACDKIINLVESENLYKRLVSNGEKRLNEFITASDRADRYFDLMKILLKNELD